jgi:hypothetical protein
MTRRLLSCVDRFPAKRDIVSRMQYRSDQRLIRVGRSRVNMLRFYHLNRIACHLVRQF